MTDKLRFDISLYVAQQYISREVLGRVRNAELYMNEVSGMLVANLQCHVLSERQSQRVTFQYTTVEDSRRNGIRMFLHHDTQQARMKWIRNWGERFQPEESQQNAVKFVTYPVKVCPDFAIPDWTSAQIEFMVEGSPLPFVDLELHDDEPEIDCG